MAKLLSIKVICILSVIIFVSSVSAVTTSVWEQNTHQDFTTGKLKNVSISNLNQIALSRALEPIGDGIPEVRIWCIVRDSKGNSYLGTGDKGKVYKINKEGKAEMIFDSPETDIVSIAIDNNDIIYAGSSPDGIIYKIEQGKVPLTFFKSEEKYIWSMVFDDSGNIYAGTGISGKLYKVSPDGKGEVVLDSNEIHIKCLLRDGNYIYAGSEGSGIIYRISNDGKVFVLYDTEGQEISGIVKGLDGNFYASAVSGETGQPSRESQEQGPPMTRGKVPRNSMVYQITPDGINTMIIECEEPIIFSIIIDKENILIGTGDEGRIYSIKTNGDWAIIADCEESQVVSLYKAKDSDEIWVVTGNPSKIYKISSNYVKEGTLESKQFDTSLISKWGNIYWDAETSETTSTTLSTRTGNTEKPDSTWSDWSEDYKDNNGTQITSPSARFIQWQLKLKSDDGISTPIVKGISVAYLQRNLKPIIESVSVSSDQDRPEGPPKRPQSPMGEEQKKLEKLPINGKKTIKWQARDPNEDKLQYNLYFRGDGEKNWKLIKDELNTNQYPIDTESFPDGAYFIKVIATDSLSNPMDFALTEEKISDRFVIDNTPPAIFELQALSSANRKYVISGRAEDNISYIKTLNYSIDGADWKPLFSLDHLLDSKKEFFSFMTDPLSEGEHTIVIKVEDSAGNVGSAKTVITAK